MKISSLICEYNPFHNGHKALLDLMRERGATHIAACMSGNFTQRGEPALLDKAARTRTALANGVDLVIELDTAHAASSAEGFAYGGVFLLNALGCVDTLTFGSECGDIELLQEAARVSASEAVSACIPILLKSGMTYAAAYQAALNEYAKADIAALFREPNNLLGIEYIKALNKLHSTIQPDTIRRIGTAHNTQSTTEGIASASQIRRLALAGGDYTPYVPKSTAGEIQAAHAGGRLHSIEAAERLILYRLRTMTPEEIRSLPDVSEGLENRIRAAALCNSYAVLVNSIKTKRYTAARIRRILLYALLGLTKADQTQTPSYIRVLGFNERGQEILRLARRRAALPIYTRHADFKKLSPQAQSVFNFNARCDNLYPLLQSGDLFDLR